MNNTKKSFKSLVKTCLQEVKEEQKQKEQLREALKKYVKKVLNESIVGPKLDEQDSEDEEEINKGFAKDGNKPTEITQDQQVQELTKIVHGIDKDFNVYRSTTGTMAYTSGKRNFIVVDAGDLFTVRINERWENNFDVEAMIRMKDRVKAIGLNWEQVKSFVKANFGEVGKTYVQSAAEKSDTNRKDQVSKRDSDMPDTSVKTRKIGNQPAKLGDEEAEDMVKKDDDKPSAQMKQVTKPGKDPETMNKAKDQKETPKPKPPKHQNDKELIKKMPGKKKG